MPSALRNAILEYCDRIGGVQIARRAAAQSACYRAGGSSLTAIADAADVAAYLTARMPATFAAIRTALAWVRECAPGFEPRSVLDFGAGPGTASWAAIEVWPGITSVTMSDINPRFIESARMLAERSEHDALRRASFDDPGSESHQQRHDLVISGYVMSELQQPMAGSLVARLWNRCGGILLIVEPGTPTAFKRILTVRESLIAEDAMIAAPCPGNWACPMQRDEWCHFAVRLPRSRDHMRAKKAIVPYEDEKFSYVAAARARVSLAPAYARIVTPVETNKSGARLRLCDAGRIAEVQVPRRDRAVYRTTARKKWGDRFDQT